MTTRKIVWVAVGFIFAGLSISVGHASDDKGLGACEGVRLTSLISAKRPQTINDIMSDWVGADLGKMVASWGAPYSTFENRDGSRIITWKDGACTKNFKVDTQDVLTHWSVSSGCGCWNGSSPRGVPRNTPVPPMTM